MNEAPAAETLATARLALRRLRVDDAAALHAILSDPRAMRYWSTRPHTDMAETQTWLASSLAALAAGRADEFAVCRDGVLVGKTGLWRDDELGLIFSPGVWGQGIAAEATGAVLARHDRLRRGRIVAEADPRNNRVLALLARLGFAETGRASRTICIAGEWCDSVYLARPPAAAPG